MRLFLLSWLLVGPAALAQTAPPAEPAGAPSESARAAEAAGLAKRAAEEYTFSRDPKGRTPLPLKLDPNPLLQWSNPVAGSIHGTVFVWTSQGRPEAVASIYKWYGPKYHHLGVEFHSLSTAPVSAAREGKVIWSSEEPGAAFAPVPGAPAPAEGAAQRLRQMRDMANEFTASETTRENVVRELRLLTRPVYRDAGTHPVAFDGALFAFVEGTDPEVFLRLEARKGDAGRPEWVYSLTRMNSLGVRARHRGHEVWSVPEMPWEVVFSHRKPYTVFLYQPGESVNPPGPPDPQ